MTVGLGAYGCAFPRQRVTRAELEAAGLAAPGDWRWAGISEPDEDALTLALQVVRPLVSAPVGSLGMASTSLPYRQRVQVGLLATSLGLDGLFVSEHTTSARAGVEALCTHAWRVQATGQSAVVVASEAGGTSLRDVGRGAVAVGVVLDEEGSVATIDAITSSVDERPGLQFRSPGDGAVQDIGVVDYSIDAYISALRAALDPLLDETGASIGDFDAVVLAGVAPGLAAKGARATGLTGSQWRDHVPASTVGDLAAAGGLFGLVRALDQASEGDRILLTSYGAGSALDAIVLRAGRGSGRGVVDQATRSIVDVDLATVLRLQGAI